MEAVAKEPERPGEQLPKMSFGDHLEELRRRLFKSLLAIGVCVLGLMPFKESVTSIYVQPYHDMWMRGFIHYADALHDKVATLGRRIAAQTGGEKVRLELDLEMSTAKNEFIEKYRAAIENGTYPFVAHGSDIKTLGGYEVSYSLIATRPIEDFWTFMAASALMAAILAAPIVLYQLWAFIGAGLYRSERRAVLKYVPGASVLLILGVVFGYKVVVPFGLYFLVQLMNFGQVQPMVSVSNYFGLLFMLTAALGVVFQLPLVMLTLHKVGIVRHEMFVKNWRYVILIIFVVAALLTPPDPFTQLMMAGPMLGLYGIGLILTGRSAKARAKLEASGGAA